MIKIFKDIWNLLQPSKTFGQEIEEEFDKNPALYDEYLRLSEKAARCKERKKYTLKVGEHTISIQRLSNWEVEKWN